MKKRVVVTGMGVLTSLGNDLEIFWKNIQEGKNGISLIERFDTKDSPTKIAAEIKNFEPGLYLDKKEARRMDRYNQFAMVATKFAIEQSGIDLSTLDPFRFGVVVGSGIGGIETLEIQQEVLLTKGSGRVSPFFIPMMIPNMASGRIAMQYGARGHNECVVTACATSTNAIGDAFKVIERGDADIMITGGSEAAITPLSFAGFSNMKAMSTNEDPESASRPFDADRDGFVMGEGAGILILEEYEHAKKRGAKIWAELAGYGCTNDAYHITSPAPDGEGSKRCMENALQDANIAPGDVHYINAHGTSTDYNDKFETTAIKRVFGEFAERIPISSTKSMTGHLLGAAGAVEAIICILAIRDGVIPPTIHYQTPDPACDLDYVPNVSRKQRVDIAISNSFGFGGCNASIVFKKVNESNNT